MEITKERLRQIINEEIELQEKEDTKLSRLFESYVNISNYGIKQQTIDKEAIINFLTVLKEDKLPIETFEAIVNTLPSESVKSLLEELLEE
jgi:hypothetical protein